MKIQGNVWKFGDNIDTDVIIPARYLNVSEEHLLAQKCFADTHPDFMNMISKGDIIVAGKNFGLWFKQGACADSNKGRRHKLRYRGKFRADILS